MKNYTVKQGDSPARIAIEYAGCPRCARDLIAANKHKPTVRHPNGYETFQDLRAGEKLNLPDKWFNGELDLRPRAYFAALPHHDGVTAGVGAPNVLNDYAALDAAAAKVGALAALGDQAFAAAVNGAADAVDTTVREIGDATTVPTVYAAPYARDVRAATSKARQYNTAVLDAAIAAGDAQESFQARTEILKNLSSALGSARLALQAFYGDAGDGGTAQPAAPQPAPEIQVDIGPATIDPTLTSPTVVTAAAQAAVAAIGADANYCMSISQPRSAVNSAVHSFKTTWNAANPNNPVPIGTGTYEQATADAIMRTIGHAPVACGAGAAPSSSGPGGASTPPLVAPEPSKGIGVAGILGLGLLGAGAVGGALYYATREAAPPRRRVRRVSPKPRRRSGQRDTIGPWKKDPSS
jgi:hypothetical protein